MPAPGRLPAPRKSVVDRALGAVGLTRKSTVERARAGQEMPTPGQLPAPRKSVLQRARVAEPTPLAANERTSCAATVGMTEREWDSIDSWSRGSTYAPRPALYAPHPAPNTLCLAPYTQRSAPEAQTTPKALPLHTSPPPPAFMLTLTRVEPTVPLTKRHAPPYPGASGIGIPSAASSSSSSFLLDRTDGPVDASMHADELAADMSGFCDISNHSARSSGSDSDGRSSRALTPSGDLMQVDVRC